MLSLNKLSGLFLLFFFSFSQSALETRVSFRFTEAPLDHILLQIKEVTGVHLLFSDQHLNQVKRSLKVDNVSLQECLDLLFNEIPLSYEFNSKMNLLIIKEELVDLKGYVKDSSFGQLPYAIVRIPDTQHAVYANKYGYFALVDVPYKNYEVVVEHIGYEPKRYKLRQLNLQADLELELEPQIYLASIENIAVASDYSSYQSDYQRTSFVPEAVSVLPSMGTKDLFRSLQTLPGVSGGSNGTSGLHIRGGTPDQNLIKLDGMTFYHTDHFFGYYSAFNPRILKDVLLYKGAYSSKYGGRLSGILELTGKTASFTETEFNISADFLNFQANVGIPISDHMSVMIATRKSHDISDLYSQIYSASSEQRNSGEYADLPKTPARDSIHQFTNGVYGFEEINVKLSYIPTDNDILNLNYYYSKDKFASDYTFALQNNKKTIGGITSDWGNNGMSLQWFHNFSSRFNTNMFISRSMYKNNHELNAVFHRFERKNGKLKLKLKDRSVDQESSIETNDITIDNELFLSSTHQLNFGLEYANIRTSYASNDSIKGQQTHTISAYAEDLWKLSPSATLSSGARFVYDHFSRLNTIEPRLSFTKEFIPGLSFQIAGGMYHQYINKIINNDVMSGARDLFVLSNDVQFKVGKSNKVQTGVHFYQNDFELQIDAYYTDVQSVNEIQTLVEVNEKNDKYKYKLLAVNGSGVNSGLEFHIKKSFDPIHLSLGYTRSNSEIEFDLKDKLLPISSGFLNEHQFNGLLSYQYEGWHASVNYIYLSGRPYTKVEYYKNRYIRGKINDARLPDTFKTDLKLTHSFDLFHLNFEAGFSINNVFNRENVTDIYYLTEVAKFNSISYIKNAEERVVYDLPRVYSFSLDISF